MSARDVVRSAAEKLAGAGTLEPRASAEVLLSELLGIRRGELAGRREPLSEGEASAYAAWIGRREAREPVQRILGYAYFRNLKLSVNEHTLIPRSDTESVVDAALERIDRRGYPCRVLDLGTGTGAIGISISQERPRCEVHASDVSREALRVATRNISEAEVEVKLHRADLTEGLAGLAGSVDLLVSNPPYVRRGGIEALTPEVRDWDPPLALDGGPDGLDYYRRIFAEAPALLKPGAEVVLEVGDGQAEEVSSLAERSGFEPVGVRNDLTRTSRAVVLRWPG